MAPELQISRVENWKPVQGYEQRYLASYSGRIKSSSTDKVLAGGVGGTGYWQVLLYNNGKRQCFKVHRLIAIAFIPNPKNYPVINHKDGNKLNNCVSNLEWCDMKHNNIHAYQTKLKLGPLGIKNGFCKLQEKDVIEIRQLRKQNKTLMEIAGIYNVSFQLISRISNNKNWKHL